jgi:hypothetical protein
VVATSPAEAEANLERRQLVSAFAPLGLRDAALETQRRQLAAPLQPRHAFDVDQERDNEVELVRNPWARLRRAW